MKSSLERELEEQSRWQYLPGKDGFRPFYDRLVAHEFMPLDEQKSLSAKLLAPLLSHAITNVPYYARLFADKGVTIKDIKGSDELPLVPVMTKGELLLAGEELIARSLPAGETIFGWFSSSGTTGKPAKVLHTVSSNLMFTLLAQRQYRWYRFDPQGVFASIRLASQQLRCPDGSRLADGKMLKFPAWRYGGSIFYTGPFLCFNIENPVEHQLEWLAEQQPDYLQSYSESLEHLAFACDGLWPVPGLKKLFAISEQLTPSMKHRIESTTGVPVEQSYGLNEIGLVAIKCRAGRYHWHLEQCIVEIADEDGHPCQPGEYGRLLVTALRNFAMPLIRYDTGDLAEVVTGDCPCGRTLPSFGQIVGRYSRIAYLPEGTLYKVGLIRQTLEAAPVAMVKNLRQFQIHQFGDGRFELRLLASGDLSVEFYRFIKTTWEEAGEAGSQLAIRHVATIPRSPGGKFQDFTSDFIPSLDES